METIMNILEAVILRIGKYEIMVSTLLIVLLIFVATKVLLWIIRKAIFRKRNLERIEMSNAYSLYQIIKYLLWIISILFMMQTLGISITVLLAGSLHSLWEWDLDCNRHSTTSSPVLSC